MEQIAFAMQLKPGVAAEYQKRHDEIWPELVAALKDAGISDYSIFLDEATGTLFAVQRRTADNGADALPGLEVVQKWWAWNAPLMEVHPDNEPVARPLRRVFHLP
ncbi:L-rhamnose mutarotase [Tropicimonas sp. IMCC34043]|uniref:L-rhamnose mutarotase n=1 Tax=Tropicimonas sp. IMCC34043 TaxID=2248760 RepID=UPI000E2345AD|nr:L-rhamnose mutarotase [Tropicimonas sp. IMCC34043]